MRIQDKREDLEEATAGMQVSISIDDAILGRTISEGSELYVNVPEPHKNVLLSKFKESLNPDELELLDVISEKFEF